MKRTRKTKGARGQKLMAWGDCFCQRCRRRLRSEASNRLGMGPTCRRHVQREQELAVQA